jgi:hypothetical protein
MWGFVRFLGGCPYHESYVSAVLDRHVAVGEMVRDDGDVASHGRGRVSQGSAELDCKAIRCVGVIRRPVLRPVMEQSSIEATTSTCAALPQDLRVLGRQGIDHMVDSEHVRVVVRRPRHLVNPAVVVPLDVRYIGVVEDVRDGVDDMLLDFRQAEVENQFAACESPLVVACVHDPIWVLLVKGRVRVDHF